MSKTLKKNDLHERKAIRTLLVVSLFASIAAFGCTTDRTIGNGDPVVTPGIRTSPTGGAVTGTETESIPPPMISSYSGVQTRSAVRPRISREEAALLLVEMQPRVKVLGPVSPGLGSSASRSDRIALNGRQVYGRSTINSTLESPVPSEGILSGAGEPLATGTAVGAGNIAGSTAVTNASSGVVIAPSSPASATPTGFAIGTPSALASVRTLSPSAASVVNPPASISSSSTLATESSSRTAGTAGTVVTGATPTQAVAPQSVSSTATAATVSPVRIVTGNNGRVTVTNASARQQ